MKILLVEDEAALANLLVKSLQAENHIVDSARDGEEGSFLARTNDYDLVIMDYMLPKLDGLGALKEIRADKSGVPILMLTVRTEISDKVEALENGADDYLTKPFSMSELSARIRALGRRPRQQEENILVRGNITLDSNNYSVCYKNQSIYLSAKEFALLEFFMKNSGRVLSRQKILENVWDMNADPFSNTVEMHIMKLRKKLHDNQQKLIITLPNRGYRLECPEK